VNIVVDANVIISALIKESHTRHFLILSGHSFYVPEFILGEISEHVATIQRKAGLGRAGLSDMLEWLCMSAKITVVASRELKPFVPKARFVSPDPDDVQYFALALKLGCPIWSNDKRLKTQNAVRIYSSKELMGVE
jgi:predicted nucleic acid-binding protein